MGWRQTVLAELTGQSRYAEPGVCPRCQTPTKDFELMPAPDGEGNEKWCYTCINEYVDARPWPGILGIIT